MARRAARTFTHGRAYPRTHGRACRANPTHDAGHARAT